MESGSWSRFSASASKRHYSAFRSRYAEPPSDANLRSWRELFSEFEEFDGGEEESSAEFACPFCSEEFDIVGLCCHIDGEHPVEAKNGVCPICMVSVGLDLVGHLTTQHASFQKVQHRRTFLRGRSSPATHAMLSMLRRDFRDSNMQALLGGSSSVAPPKAAASDPFISSLIYTLPGEESPKDAHLEMLDETNLSNNNADEKVVKRVEPVEATLSNEEQKELATRRKFVQGLVLSTIFDDQ